MNKMVTIHCRNNDSHTTVEMGASLLEILQKLNLKTAYPIINAKVNNKTESLTFRVYGNKTIEFVDLSHTSAMRSYSRSLCFMLIKAIKELYPKMKLNLEHPVSKGYFCRVVNGEALSQARVDAIKAKMTEYAAANMPFEEIEEETEKVVARFKEAGYEDKAKLLETSGQLYSKYYKLGNSINYYYGSMVPFTGYLKLFGLELYHDGMLLRIPNREHPVELEPVVEQNKMFNVYKSHLEFLDVLKLSNVGDLNKAIQDGKLSQVIQISEAMQERNIANIAEDISKRAKDDGTRIVLVSGPSSSGKTTFRMRLEIQLMTNLWHPVGLSLDDYFVNREDTPLDENGGYDFESLYALDIPQFNKDLEALLAGKEVELPTFNFTTGKREYKGNKLKLSKDSILIIEGIHGLNPELTRNIPAKNKYQVYISALTTISLDDHNWIPTTDNRLLRRMIRDYQYRGYSAIDTLSRWPSVRKGEEKWIFPFQENADAMVNSAMIYELATLRPHAERILREVPNNVPEYAEAHRLLKFVQYFNYVNDSELPPTSLLREFLGGSSFKY